MLKTKEGLNDLPFVPIKQITGGGNVTVDTEVLLADLPTEDVNPDQIISALGINNWTEAITSLPSTYLEQLINGKVKILPPVLIKHEEVYIGTGIGNRSIVLGKILKKESISAYILQAPFS